MDIASVGSDKIGKHLKGTSIKIKELVGKPIIVVDYIKVKSKKEDCDYYYSFSIIMKGVSNGKATKLAFYTHTGAKDITAFFDHLKSEEIQLPLLLKVCEEGKSMYFEGYRFYNEKAANDLISEFNIDESLLAALD